MYHLQYISPATTSWPSWLITRDIGMNLIPSLPHKSTPGPCHDPVSRMIPTPGPLTHKPFEHGRHCCRKKKKIIRTHSATIMSCLDELCEHCHGLLSTKWAFGWQGLWNNRVVGGGQTLCTLVLIWRWSTCKQQLQSIITVFISEVKGDSASDVLTWICVPLWLLTVPLSTHLCP